MLVKTITYKDFNGEERTEDFYFNLTEAELTEMSLSVNGGLDAYIKRIIAAQDTAELIKLFKELIQKAYGEKSLDGKRFIKNSELLEAFMQTNAYSDFFMELATDSKAASDFVNGIIPSNIEEELKKTQAAQGAEANNVAK